MDYLAQDHVNTSALAMNLWKSCVKSFISATCMYSRYDSMHAGTEMSGQICM